MSKRGLSLFVSAVMLTMFALTGCGGGTKALEESKAVESSETAGESKSEEAKSEESKDSSKVIVVGYAQVGAESDWRTANTESFKSTFVPENGYELIFNDAQQKQENQIKAIRDFIQQEVDYIVLAPVVETGWDTVLQEAKDAGIPDDSLYTALVCGDFIKEGETAGHWLEDYLKSKNIAADEKTNIVTLQGTIGASAQVGRTDGFANILGQNANWNMLAKQTGEFTQSKGQEVMESFLKQFDDIDVVVAENDNMAFGAIDAIKAAGKTCGPEGDITVISFDAVKAAFDAMIAGDLNASIECSPLHGPRVAEIIQKLEKGETVDKIQYVDESYFDTSMDLEKIKAGRAY